jgi:hypothetical protein
MNTQSAGQGNAARRHFSDGCHREGCAVGKCGVQSAVYGVWCVRV